MALLVYFVLAPGPASAQRLDDQLAALAAGFAAKAAAAVANTLPVDDLIVKAIKRISERDYQLAALFAPPSAAEEFDCSGIHSCDRDEPKNAPNRKRAGDISAWQQLMATEGLKYFGQPEALDLV